MIYIEAPTPFERGDYDWDTWAVFLAGGITNCPNWQAQVADLLSDEEIIIVNPRRENFDITNPEFEREQITWEQKAFEEVDLVAFWFPAATLCPITLFELGKQLAYNAVDTCAEIAVIGIEPGYQREMDIRIQTELMDLKIPITNSFEEYLELIIKRSQQ